MVEKLKTKINELKMDSHSIERYVECFCKNAKAEELFKLNYDYKKLKEKQKNKEY